MQIKRIVCHRFLERADKNVRERALLEKQTLCVLVYREIADVRSIMAHLHMCVSSILDYHRCKISLF